MKDIEKEKAFQLLFNELKSNFHTYTSREAGQLADKILELYNWETVKGPVPIVFIAEYFGIKVYTDSDLPEQILGNIYANGTTKDIYMDLLLLL